LNRGGGIDLNQPSEARLYDLFLGGKNNFEVDRRLFQELVKLAPEAPQAARANRRWLAEAIGRMVTEGGITQFLDLGAGLPTAQNTHEIALAANPDAIVVYVDNDLTAISHGQALLADDIHSFFAGADLTDPAVVLNHPAVTGALDLTKAVGLILGLVLHTVPKPQQLLEDYLAALPSGSYLALTHPINPRDGSRYAEFATALEEKIQDAFPDVRFRTRDEVAELLTGLEVVEPGLVDLTAWWSTGDQSPALAGAAQLLQVALARKP
jgi:trans-aconitate methyltransferase